MAAISYQVDVVLDVKAILGEGPFYERETHQLVWVDIDRKTINFLNLTDSTNRQLHFSQTVGAAIPCTVGKSLVAVLGRTICLVDSSKG